MHFGFANHLAFNYLFHIRQEVGEKLVKECPLKARLPSM